MAITRISFRLLLAAMIPAAVRAADAQSPIPDSLATTLARVRPTEVLRLSVAGNRIAGVFERLPDGGSLRHVTSDRFISITSIDSIWHRRSNVRAGSRNGVKMGALAGGFLLPMVARGLRGEDGSVLMAIPLGAASGGLLGGAIGGLVGSASANWTMIYSRR